MAARLGILSVHKFYLQGKQRIILYPTPSHFASGIFPFTKLPSEQREGILFTRKQIFGVLDHLYYTYNDVNQAIDI